MESALFFSSFATMTATWLYYAMRAASGLGGSRASVAKDMPSLVQQSDWIKARIEDQRQGTAIPLVDAVYLQQLIALAEDTRKHGSKSLQNSSKLFDNGDFGKLFNTTDPPCDYLKKNNAWGATGAQALAARALTMAHSMGLDAKHVEELINKAKDACKSPVSTDEVVGLIERVTNEVIAAVKKMHGLSLGLRPRASSTPGKVTWPPLQDAAGIQGVMAMVNAMLRQSVKTLHTIVNNKKPQRTV